MPVRSLNSPVLKWPDSKTVIEGPPGMPGWRLPSAPICSGWAISAPMPEANGEWAATWTWWPW